MDGNIALGLVLVAAGCAGIYLASPNQHWRAAPWSAKTVKAARTAGGLLLIGGLAAFLQTMRPPTAAFVFVHWLMLLFVLFPYLGALLAAHRGRHS